jgi:hypothetical protein
MKKKHLYIKNKNIFLKKKVQDYIINIIID